MVDVLCPDCSIENPDERELTEYLIAFVRDLNPAEKTDEAAYTRRLAACRDCPHRVKETCGVCGCYVRVRAAKRRMDCPCPGKSKWG